MLRFTYTASLIAVCLSNSTGGFQKIPRKALQPRPYPDLR